MRDITPLRRPVLLMSQTDTSRGNKEDMGDRLWLGGMDGETVENLWSGGGYESDEENDTSEQGNDCSLRIYSICMIIAARRQKGCVLVGRASRLRERQSTDMTKFLGKYCVDEARRS